MEFQRKLHNDKIHDSGIPNIYNTKYIRHVLFHLPANQTFLLIFADLDNLKPTNDKLGHSTGNDLLQQSANILLKTPDAIVGRYGGDEFLALKPYDPTVTPPEKIQKMVSQVIEENTLTHNSSTTEGDLPISFSIGFAHLKPGDDPRKTLDEADKMMYRIKNAKKTAPTPNQDFSI
ncbi:MAG: GGDEF domain-containing protein [Patescibacteria group bacterium]